MPTHRISLSDAEIEIITTALNSAVRPSRKWSGAKRDTALLLLERLLDGGRGNPKKRFRIPNEGVINERKMN